ncbi:MAG: methyl-accepting chemotaxis protein [Alphaproteobacteria bacterium]|nr:methyl-accepting chemotaxis protein [Alphaproteobacteria bacterium]
MDPKETLIRVVDLSMSSVEVSVTSARILSSARDIHQAATTMAGAVVELNASIGEIENAAQKSSNSAETTHALTQQGLQEIQQLQSLISNTGSIFSTVSDKTRQLQSVVSNLGNIVFMISKIAAQTNLLALNATIEAARAGEHGKGFSVVASEVKSLSRQTAEASGSIIAQIKDLDSVFADVQHIIDQSNQNLTMVVSQSSTVAGNFENINTSAEIISSQVRELATVLAQQQEAVELLAQNMNTIKNKGDENLGAVETLATQSDKSVQLIEDWRTLLAKEEITDKVIYLAKSDHLLWKKRLLDMALGRNNLKAKELTDHTTCRLGKWYYSEDSRHYRNHPAFKAMEEAHKHVHQSGIQAAQCFEQNRLEEGLKFFEALELASCDVLNYLEELAKDTHLKTAA